MVMSAEKIDFDEILNRRNTNCGKWDTMDQKYQSEDLLHLGVADMDFKAPEAIIQGFREVVEHGVFGYTDLNRQFYDSIIGWMKRRNGVGVEREQIVFCPRINIASSICVETFTQPGEEVMIHTPAYAPLYQAIVKNNRTVVESPLSLKGDRYEMDFDQMERAVTGKTKMLILCSPHNPVGRVWTKEELARVGEFCVRHGLVLFVDEIHGDILARGTSFTSILQLPEPVLQHVVLATSLTKTFNIPGAIISYMIIPEENLREKVKEDINRVGMHNPSVFALSAVENGYTKCDDWYKAMLAYVDENESFTREYFGEHMPAFHILPREGTYLLWISYKDLGCSEAEMERWFLNEAKVSVYMGTVFGAKGEGFIRLNIASPRLLLMQAYERMRAAYTEL